MRRVLLACAVAVAPVVVTAQSPVPAPASAAAQGTAADPPGAQDAPAKPSPLEPQGYSYNTEGRRDPFISLVRRGTDAPGTPGGVRPGGLAGLGASEVTLRGTVRGRDGWVGLLLGTDKRTYLARPGDSLLDGTVRSITADTLVILQRVNDPLSPQSEREVRKVIRQTEEAQ